MKRSYTTEELSEVLISKNFVEACKKYGDGIKNATRFVQTCFDCNITPLPGNYLISKIVFMPTLT